MAASDYDIGKLVRLKKSAQYQVKKGKPYPQAGDLGEIVDCIVYEDGQEYYVHIPGYVGEWIFEWDEMQPISIKQIMLENNNRNKPVQS